MDGGGAHHEALVGGDRGRRIDRPVPDLCSDGVVGVVEAVEVLVLARGYAGAVGPVGGDGHADRSQGAEVAAWLDVDLLRLHPCVGGGDRPADRDQVRDGDGEVVVLRGGDVDGHD